MLLALLVALAVWLTRDTRELRVYELSSKDSVTGLQPQASVRFKGVNVGKVTAIGFDPKAFGRVLIRIAIDDQAPITPSTFATLGFQGVTGLAFVQLDDSGESSARIIEDRQLPTRIPMRPGLLSKLSDQGTSVLSELEESARRINLLLQRDNQQNLMKTIASLGQAADRIAQLSTATNRVLPQLVQDANATLKIIQDTSIRVGVSADEARASARAFKAVTERMNANDGTLDQLAKGATTLSSTGQTLNSTTLPRVNRAVEDAARAARQVSRTAGTFSDNPQSLLFGNSPVPPGPGEPGFSASPGKP